MHHASRLKSPASEQLQQLQLLRMVCWLYPAFSTDEILFKAALKLAGMVALRLTRGLQEKHVCIF